MEREALQMCLEYIETNAHERKHVRHAIQAALAQPAQEPVAWVCEGCASDEKHAIDYWQEDVDDIPIGTLLYAAPPQRPWVGLTAEDFSAIKFPAEMRFPAEFRAGARWAEVKLKDKNT